MLFGLEYFAPILPEMILLFGIFVTILVRLLVDKCSYEKVYLSSQITLAISFMSLFFTANIISYGSVYSDLLEIDAFSFFVKGLLIFGMGIIFCYGKSYVKELKNNNGDYYLLALLSLLGMMILSSAANLLMVYLGIEVMSLPIYAMVALWRDDSICVEAGLKYFITGALASCLLLYGFSLLYGVTASLSLAEIKVFLLTHAQNHSFLLPLAIVFITAGFAFKLGLVPLHMWAPDVYEGSALPVTMLIATLPKIATLTAMLRIFVFALATEYILWSKIFLLLAISSIIIGNLVALRQTNLKRLLAYSSIAHMGYMLLGVATADSYGYSASLFYIIVYIIANLAIFGVMLSMHNKKCYPSNIDDLSGLNKASPLFSLLLLVTLFSMAGVPPIVGFMAKMWVFDILIHQHMISVAVLAVLFTLLGAYYYIRVIKTIYFNDDSSITATIICSMPCKALLCTNGAVLLLFGLFPSQIFNLCSYLTIGL
ncbi:MAG: NADH-quinone oxidoreductase subunit N [Legionellales bacterium]|jgi:NADH-quinone oxidoreductase subunit N|nr:NADH-quinone oxidoreductase subunit N [Legionellales bacterium]